MLVKFAHGMAAILTVMLLLLTPAARASELFDEREDLLLELILFDRFDRFEEFDRFDRFEEFDRFDRFEEFDRFDRFEEFDRFDRFEKRFDRPGLGFGRIGPQGRARGFDR